MAAWRPDDSDLARDLEQTVAQLQRLRDAYARILPADAQHAATIARQIESCERHLAIQRVNVGAAT